MIYIPFWKRPPNKFIRYEDVSFSLKPNAYGFVLNGIETIAIFKDKNGKEQRMTAHIKWLNRYDK